MKKIQMFSGDTPLQIREITNEDFNSMIKEGEKMWFTLESKSSGHGIYYKEVK